MTTGDSMIDGINEKNFSTNFQLVKVRFFRGVTIDDMSFILIPLLKGKPAVFILHLSTNNFPHKKSFQIYDILLNLVHFIKNNNPNCHVVLSSSIDRL